jgi:hypothetical protein
MADVGIFGAWTQKSMEGPLPCIVAKPHAMAATFTFPSKFK